MAEIVDTLLDGFVSVVDFMTPTTWDEWVVLAALGMFWIWVVWGGRPIKGD